MRLLEEAALPLYALDDQRRVVFANAALGEWLGQEADSLVGLRRDYHAGGGEKASSEVGAALCPPPEAFSGECEAGQIAARWREPAARRAAGEVCLASGRRPAGAVVGLPARAGHITDSIY